MTILSDNRETEGDRSFLTLKTHSEPMKSQYSQIQVRKSMMMLIGRHNRSQFPKLMQLQSG